MSKQPYLRLVFAGPRPGNRLNAAQISDAIRRQIVASGLEGCRLPPVRVLAHQLGASKTTIEAVYGELKARGLVESRNRRGLFVAAREEDQPSLRRGQSPSAAKAGDGENLFVPAPALRPFSTPTSLSSISGLLQLSSPFIDPRVLPRDRLCQCFRSVLRQLPERYDAQGYLPLRRWIAERLRRRGMAVRAEQVIITNGSQQALDLVIRSLATRTVATENPAYALAKCLLEQSGVRAVGLPLNPFSGLDLESWRSLLDHHRPGLVYLTSRFQNPTGYSYSSGELQQIIAWSRQLGFGILEDDWGSDMLSFSEFTPCLRALGGENVLYMNSFTKKLWPSLRIGYLVASEATVEPLIASKRVSCLGLPALIERGLYDFLEQGFYDAFLKRMQLELDRRYRCCLDLLDELMPEEVRWTSPGGGPQLWLELPRLLDLGDLAARLRARRVAVDTQEVAFFGRRHLHGIRIGYAFLSPEDMRRGLEIVAEEIRTRMSITRTRSLGGRRSRAGSACAPTPRAC